MVSVMGISHHTAPIIIREKITFSGKRIDEAYLALKKEYPVKEVVLLSTCNRTEIYYSSENFEERNRLKNFIMDFFCVDESIFKYFYEYKNVKAIKHLYRVTAGLDSLVIGEDQILGQVKTAHSKALQQKATGSVINTLFRYAVTCAKKIKTETKISRESISISSIAVKLLKQEMANFRNKSFFIMGLGKMGLITLKNLICEGVDKIYISSRNLNKLESIKKNFSQVKILDFKRRMEKLAVCDVLVSSSAAPHYILRKEEFEKYYHKEKSIYIIDLAVPRDVEPSIGQIENVTLKCLDDLKAISLINCEKRLRYIEKANCIIKENIRKYLNWCLNKRALIV